MADLNEIVDSLSSLTVMQAAELAKLLEEKWGVSAAAPVAVAGAAAGAAAAPVEEKTEFDVILIAARRQEDPGHQGGPRASRVSASRRPRTWSRARRSRSRKASPRTRPTKIKAQIEAAGGQVEIK